MVTQDVVESGLVVAFTFGEPFDHQNSRQSELATREIPRSSARNRHAPRRDFSSADLLARFNINHRNGTRENCACAEYRSLTHSRALSDYATASDVTLVLDNHRRCLRWFKDTADSDPTREVNVLADLRAGSDRGPGVDHRVLSNVSADVDITRHHHHSRCLVAAPASLCSRHNPHATSHEITLERDLVGVLERRVLDRLHPGDAKQQQHRELAPLVHCDAAVGVDLRNPGSAGIKFTDGFVDSRGDLRIVEDPETRYQPRGLRFVTANQT